MKKWRKLSAAFLAATMIFSSFALAGCGKKKSTGETVSEDTPWYTMEKIDLTSTYYDEYPDLEYVYFNYLGTINGNYLLSVDGNLKIPDDFDWETDDYEQYRISEFVLFDSEGNKVNTMDATTIASGEYEYISNYSLVDDKVVVTIDEWDSRTYEDTYYNVEIDPITGEVGERVPLNNTEINQEENESNEGTETIGNYSITKLWKYGENDNNSYRLVIADENGDTTSLDMQRIFPGVNIFNIDSIIDIGDDKALILASGNGNMVFTLDFASMTLEQMDDEDTEWLKDVNTYSIVSCNGGAYTTDQSGVKKLDFDNGEVTEVFDFNYCNVSRYDSQNYTLLDISEDELTFMANTYHYYSYIESVDEYYLVKFTKADSNPNVGKTIISLGCLNGISQAVATAVCDYNDTNEEYFITYVNDYGDYDIDWEDDWTNEDWENAYMNAQADMSNQLAMDLMNGDGPDIIIGGFMYGQLNNDNYLLDISDYVNDFGVSGYFSNVFDGAKTGDKLYQLPLGFYISGIVTDRSNVNDGQTGFTFEEYLQFVDEVCNGKDPINMGRITYFAECVNAMNDLFIDGNSVDYSNDAFAELAEYCKDNVNEHFDYDDGIDIGWEEEWVPDAAYYSSFSGFGDYLNSYNNVNGPQSQVILGIPSYDGRGPAIQVADSAAIAATAADPDACWDFIEILLGSDSQEMVAKSWYFPVNIDAFETVANLQVNGYNEEVRNEGNYSYSGFGSTRAEIDSSIIDDFETEIIASAHLVSNDPSITVIISEEIPAYFSGQKDIDQVVDILENRVNTVLSERG